MSSPVPLAGIGLSELVVILLVLVLMVAGAASPGHLVGDRRGQAAGPVRGGRHDAAGSPAAGLTCASAGGQSPREEALDLTR